MAETNAQYAMPDAQFLFFNTAWVVLIHSKAEYQQTNINENYQD